MYFNMSNLIRFIRRRWYLRVSIMIFMNIFLFIFVSFPNPVLFIEQLHRQSIGIDSMITTDNPIFVKFAEEAYKYNKKNPEMYIYKTIKEKRDCEIYGNIEYWAYPHETIERGAGDCEDLSILTSALYKYIKEKHGRAYEEKIIRQPLHFYVLKNDTIRNRTEIYGWKMPEKEFKRYLSPVGRLTAYINELPPWRWFIYLSLTILMNYIYYIEIYSIGENG